MCFGVINEHMRSGRDVVEIKMYCEYECCKDILHVIDVQMKSCIVIVFIYMYIHMCVSENVFCKYILTMTICSIHFIQGS